MADLPLQWGGLGIPDFYQVRAIANHAGNFYHHGSISAPGSPNHADAPPSSYPPDGVDFTCRPVFRPDYRNAQPGCPRQLVQLRVVDAKRV